MTIKKMTIPYGNSMIEFEIPASKLVFDGALCDIPRVKDFEDTLRTRLSNPIGCPPLSDQLNKGDKVLILIEDATRNTPVKSILPILVEHLESSGIQAKDIEILTAPGTHRVMTAQEIIDKVGQDIVQKLVINQHDYQDESSMIYMDSVEVEGFKIPVQINKKVQEFDFIIGLGNIIPHSDAGFSGGAKIMQPGICGYATTAATHIAAALLDEIPLGNVENPCRLGMEKVARQAGLKFIINTVMNYKGEIIDIVTGDFVDAHRHGANISKKAYSVYMSQLADIVIVSSHPADIDFWQALKGVTAAYFAVKKGGYIIFASPCYEGLEHNHPQFKEWLKLTYDQIVKKSKNAPMDDRSIDLISADLAVCNSRVREKANVLVVTHGLTQKELDILQYTPYLSVQDAIDFAIGMIPDATIGLLPRGGDSLPILL
ncbi:MAG: nickel-dependent lactate racemase [Bacillota bacterium]|nr:nickel-dependent lactate racemase [Bacillota bacterium]